MNDGAMPSIVNLVTSGYEEPGQRNKLLALLGGVVGGFEGFRLKFAITLQQNLYFAFGILQFFPAGA